jgi:predicted acylesterase/phospholipase RssA
MELPRYAVITIQGGGAVAVDLIGQLQGLTGDEGLRAVGVAGTSAGAIIATLYWSGYSPDSIRDEVVKLFAPARIDAFFGRAGRFGVRFTGFASFAQTLTALFAGRSSSLADLIWPGWRRIWLLPIWWVWQFLMFVLRGVVVIVTLLTRQGIFPGDGLVREVDRLLRASPLLEPHRAKLPCDRLLRFGDVTRLHDIRTMPLFLIVTDVCGADMMVASSVDPACEDLQIAEAVRASAGFPIFFQPMRLSDQFKSCIDGGVISNFPAWVFGFDYRKSLRASGDPLLNQLAYTPWLHIGLRLPDDTVPPPTGEDAAAAPSGFYGFLCSLAGLLVGRARARLDDKLATVAAKRLSVKPTAAPSADKPRGVLDFAALSNRDLVNAAFDRGRANGRATIEPACFALPDAASIRPILEVLAERGRTLLAPWLVPDSKIRVNIFVPDDGELALAYQVNMDGDPDEHIRFAEGEGISSLVYSQHVTVVADLRSREQSGGAVPSGTDLYLDRKGAPAVSRDRTWLLSMPLVDVTEMWWPRLPEPGIAAEAFSLDIEGPVLGVLNIDAAVDYSAAAAPSPANASTHPAVLALFDGMKSAAVRCSMEFNRQFLR